MNDRVVLAAIIGGIGFALVGGLLLIYSVQLIVYVSSGHVDGGDDGWGILWLLLTIISGLAGSIASAQWARKRHSDFQA